MVDSDFEREAREMEKTRMKFYRVSLTAPDACSYCGYRGADLPEGCVCTCCGFYKPAASTAAAPEAGAR